MGLRRVTSRKVVINSWLFFAAKTNTAIAVSSAIKEVIQKQALATRLTQKEVVYLGMLAIDALDKESRQELADKVHQMQVNGEIWGWGKPGQTLIESVLSNPVASELFISLFSSSAFSAFSAV